MENGLESEREQQAWHVLTLAQSSLRMGPMGGCLGLDLGVVIALAQAFGYEAGPVVDLIGSANGEITEKLNQR